MEWKHLELAGSWLVVDNIKYLICFPNNFRADCISLYNPLTKKFLRRYDSKLIESFPEFNPARYVVSSSFIPEVVRGKIFLKPSDDGLKNVYYYKNKGVYIFSPRYNASRFRYGFKLHQEKSSWSDNAAYSFELLQHHCRQLKLKYTELKNRYDEEFSCGKFISLSKSITKKKRVIFIGTGKPGSNSQYVFEYMCRQLKINHTADLELMYFAKNEEEKKYFDRLKLPCLIWNCYDFSQIIYVLQAKVAVYSVNMIVPNLPERVLHACVAGAYKIQLWHGILVKMVGCAGNLKKQGFNGIMLRIGDYIMDAVNAVLNNQQLHERYELCFPGAKIVSMGEARSDVLFYEHPDPLVDGWCAQNKHKIKVLFAPTFRETRDDAAAFVESLLNFFKVLDRSRLALAVKFHPSFFRWYAQKQKLLNLLEAMDIRVIPENADANIIMPKFDALVSDYSSIRIDFLLTKKPVFLFRPDLKTYVVLREINPVPIFDTLDAVCYPADLEHTDLAETIRCDPLRIRRLDLIKNLGFYTDGRSSARAAAFILENL